MAQKAVPLICNFSMEGLWKVPCKKSASIWPLPLH